MGTGSYGFSRDDKQKHGPTHPQHLTLIIIIIIMGNGNGREAGRRVRGRVSFETRNGRETNVY